jgi:hypothetical protein
LTPRAGGSTHAFKGYQNLEERFREPVSYDFEDEADQRSPQILRHPRSDSSFIFLDFLEDGSYLHPLGEQYYFIPSDFLF